MRFPEKGGLFFAAAASIVGLFGASALTGCTPDIGDSCTLSTDCASDGTRVCDTSEPGGYCTVLDCTGNNLGSVCPDNATCINFNPNVPGCPPNAAVVGRNSQAECRNGCSSNSDCRTDYLCANPREPPWSAQILDPDQSIMVCLPMLTFNDSGVSTVNYGYDGSLDAIPPVCQASGPTFDAGFPPLDAPVDTGADAPPESGRRDAEKHDAGHQDAATDAKHDATLDSGHEPDAHEAGAHEAATDAPGDAGMGDGHAPKDAVADAHDAGG